MDKRIRIIWIMSIVTMLLIFISQCYWLYNQYKVMTARNIQKVYADCDSILKKEEENRQDIKYKNAANPKSDEKTPRKKQIFESIKIQRKEEILSRRIQLSIHPDSNNLQKMETSIRFFLSQDGKKMQEVKLQGVKPEDGVTITNRFMISGHERFSPALLNLLFRASGYDSIRNFRFFRTNVCHITPRYSVSGNWNKTVSVVYSTNPIKYENIRFDIPVPTSMVLSGMSWQLAASVLMLAALAFCLVYQMRTIIFQKRIDNLRREFMKNMIYEMKQPPTEEETDKKDALKIGETDFFYSMNELQHGNNRVIITSRQAELLKFLADSVNVMVPRETILKQIWGDDSYSNSMALNVQITYLRRALKSDENLNIEAVIKKGYILKDRSCECRLNRKEEKNIALTE